jgi:hypothetical protein
MMKKSSIENWQKEFIRWIRKATVRPKKFKGETSPQGIVELRGIFAVTPFEARQLPGEDITAGESIRCWLKPIGMPYPYSLYQCFAKGTVADLLSEQDEDVELIVKLKCLGQIKVYTVEISWGEEDRGVDYPPAFLIEDAKIK